MSQVRFKAFGLMVVFWLILLASPIAASGVNINFLDELIVLAMLPLVLARRFIDRRVFVVFSLLAVFCFFALISTYYSPFFRGLRLSVLDLFLFCKSLLLLFIFILLSNRVRHTFLRYVSESAFLFVALAFIFYPLNMLFPFFESFDTRLGMGSYSFVFSNPGEFLNVLVILGGAMFASTHNKRMKLGAILCLILALTTLRFKAFVVVAFSLMVVWVCSERVRSKFQRKGVDFSFKQLFPIRRILPILLLSALPGWVQFEEYFLGDMTPRLLLVLNGVAVAGEYFPFGAGPGTFGSAVSKMYYSPLYVSLGFDKMYGVSSEESNFLSDNFWPMVFAQYGVLGALLVIIIYFYTAKYLFKKIDMTGRRMSILIIFMFSLVMSTLGSAIMVGSIGCLYMMLIGCLTCRRVEDLR